MLSVSQMATEPMWPLRNELSIQKHSVPSTYQCYAIALALAVGMMMIMPRLCLGDLYLDMGSTSINPPWLTVYMVRHQIVSTVAEAGL
jgi:hypothetical protein